MRTVLLAGSIGVATLVGALFAYNKTRKTQRIPRQKVLTIAKSLRQQMFLSLVEIACFVKQNASKFPPDQLRQHVLDQSSSFMKNMQLKLSQVFKDISEEHYQQSVEKFYKNDLEIQYHLKRYQEEFDKAVLGVTPEFRQEVVTFFSPEKLLEITKFLLEAKMTRLSEKINQKITFQQMVIHLRAQKEEEKILRSEKLKEVGLVGKDEEVTAIYEFAVAKYLKIDKQFQSQYQKLIEQYRIKSNQHVDRFCAFPRSTSKKNIIQEGLK